MNEQPFYLASAFLSCSLSKEDKPFVDFVCEILHVHQILPVGTVGRFAAEPLNPTETMRTNILAADLFVVVATGRYSQQDIYTGSLSAGMSEMVHAESGIAFSYKKPIVAFVEEGVAIGRFLPNVTQYITLNGSREDYEEKADLIFDLLNNAYLLSLGEKQRMQSANLQRMATKGLAIWGGLAILESISGGTKPGRRR